MSSFSCGAVFNCGGTQVGCPGPQRANQSGRPEFQRYRRFRAWRPFGAGRPGRRSSPAARRSSVPADDMAVAQRSGT